MSDCKHENTDTYYTHRKCLDCGKVLADSQFGIASRMWFDSIADAQFYQNHGKVPDGSSQPIPW